MPTALTVMLTLTGLADGATLGVQVASGPETPLGANGSFPVAVPAAAVSEGSFTLSIQAQPQGQECKFLLPSGPSTTFTGPVGSALAIRCVTPLEMLYVGEWTGQRILQFTIAGDGSLLELASPSVDNSGGPLRIAVEPSHRFAYVVNNANALSISQYRIGEDGALAPLEPFKVIPPEVPQAIAFHPSGTAAYVVGTQGISTFLLSRFALDPATGQLSHFQDVEAGPAPSDVVVSAAGGTAWVANWMPRGVAGSSLWGHALDAAGLVGTSKISSDQMYPQRLALARNGTLYVGHTQQPAGSPFPYPLSQYHVNDTDRTLEYLANPVALAGDALALVLDADEHFLYVLEGLGSVAQFAIGATGALVSPPARVAIPDCGGAALAIDASGTHLYVACNRTGTLALLQAAPGRLTSVGSHVLPITPSSGVAQPISLLSVKLR